MSFVKYLQYLVHDGTRLVQSPRICHKLGGHGCTANYHSDQVGPVDPDPSASTYIPGKKICGSVQVRTRSNWFSKSARLQNLGPDHWFSSTSDPNLGPNQGPVLKGSGSNQGSGPNLANPNGDNTQAHKFSGSNFRTNHVYPISRAFFLFQRFLLTFR